MIRHYLTPKIKINLPPFDNFYTPKYMDGIEKGCTVEDYGDVFLVSAEVTDKEHSDRDKNSDLFAFPENPDQKITDTSKLKDTLKDQNIPDNVTLNDVKKLLAQKNGSR